MFMSKENIGVVPRYRFPESGEWEIVSLSFLADKIVTKNKDAIVKRVLTNSATNGVIDQADYFDREIVSKDNIDGYFIVNEGDFVYNPRISTSAPVGPISRNELGQGIMSPLYTVFRFKNINNGFYKHYFNSNFWHDYIKNRSNTGARHDRISITSDNFMKMPMPHNSETEQQKIADCLTSLDELIATENKKLEALKSHKKGLMQKLFPFEGEIKPQLRLGSFDESWKQRKLGEIYNIYSGQTPFRGDSDNFLNPTTAWIKTTDLNNTSITENEEGISDKALKKLKLLPAGTVLVAMYGGFNQIGRTGMLTYPATTNQAISALSPIADIDPFFLITQLNHRVK